MTLKLHTFPFKAMGSLCELRLYAKDREQAQAVAARAQDRINELEQRYSRYREDSLTSRINNAAGGEAVRVDEETAALLDYADQAWQQSEGLFDITSGVLRQAWDFSSGKIPEPASLDALLPLVGWEQVEWQAPAFRLPKRGMQIDFGGYVKEYAVDVAAGICRERGIEHGLVEMGGDLQVIGPHPDGSPWTVGIQHPRLAETAIATLELYQGGLATSGDYERFMEIDGRRYCHVLDPRSGWPVNGLAGVSVVAEQTLVAGSMSTITMLKQKQGPLWVAQTGLAHFWVDQLMRCGGSLTENNQLTYSQ